MSFKNIPTLLDGVGITVMSRGVSKKAAKEMAEKLNEIDPDRKFLCFHENWREKYAELNRECNSEEETLMTCRHQEWLNEIMGGGYGTEMYELVQNAIDRADNPFEAFRNVVEIGVTPPPALIYLIDELYKTYVLTMGHNSWEEICFGKPVKGVGIYAARAFSSKDRDMKGFHQWVDKHRKNGDESSLIVLAESFFENKTKSKEFFSDLAEAKGRESNTDASSEIDIDSFLRKYRRWKKSRTDT